MKNIFFVVLMLCSKLFSQEIAWSHQRLDQLIGKAAQEHKYLLIDCYATWCAPCRMMDNEVLSDEGIRNFINQNFIAVKMQFDSTQQDAGWIKDAYPDAAALFRKYNVGELPSYLVLSPSGIMVHRARGVLTKKNFLEFLKQALDTKTQLYTLLDNYYRGDKDYKKLPQLIKLLESNTSETRLRKSLIEEYVSNYLYKLTEDSILTSRDNILFVASTITGTSDKGFGIIFRKPNTVDAIIGRNGYARSVVDGTITKEIIRPLLTVYDTNRFISPPWEYITKRVSAQFGDSFAIRTVLNAKIRWFDAIHDYQNLVKANVDKIDVLGPDTAGMAKYYFNDMIWNVIFKYSGDKKILNRALGWLKPIIDSERHPPVVDSYANILYKLGRVKEALVLEEEAVETDRKNAERFGTKPDAEMIENLRKMKLGLPTWVINLK